MITNMVSLQECYEAVMAVHRQFSVDKELRGASEKQIILAEIRAILCVVGVEYGD